MKQVKTNQYPSYQSDVVDDGEYETEPPRPHTTARRYRPGDYQGEPIPPVAQRSSLHRAPQSGRRTTGSQSYTEEFASAQTERFPTGIHPRWQDDRTTQSIPAQTERLSSDREPTTRQGPSRAVKALPPRNRHRFQDSRSSQESWFQRHQEAIGGGMCAALLLVWGTVHLVAWGCNLLVDPLTYTQATNRNVATVVIGKHHARITAFVDPQTHQEEAIVIPDTGTPQLLTGKVVPFAHPLVSIEQEHNGDIVETVQGPYDDNFWWPQRPLTQSWTLSFEQKPAQK